MPSRRAFLGTIGTALLAGCNGRPTETATRTGTPTATETASPTPTETPEETPRDAVCDRSWDPSSWQFGDGRDVAAAATDDGAVFAATDRTVWRLDAATGTPVWETSYDVDESLGVEQLLASDGRLFAVGYRTVVALDAADGEQRWTFTVPGKQATAGVTGAATVDGVLYLGAVNGGTPSIEPETPYSRLYGFDAETGTMRHLRSFAEEEEWNPIPNRLSAANGTLVCALGKRLVAFDPDGTERWRTSRVEEGFWHIAIADDTAIGAAGGRLAGYRLDDGASRWHQNGRTGAIVSGGTGYTTTGETVVAFDPSTGHHVWEAEADPSGEGLAATADAVLLPEGDNEEGELTAFDAKRGCRLGSVEFPSGIGSRPVVGSGRVSAVCGEWGANSLRSLELP